MLVFGCASNFFASQKKWKMGFLYVPLVWTSQFFPIHERDGKLGFLNISLACTSKFLHIHQKFEKLGFLNSPYFHILSDCEDSLSGMVFVKGRESQLMIKIPVFKNRNGQIYATILCQFKCWKYCLQAQMRVKNAIFPCFWNKPHLFAKASNVFNVQ